MKKANYRRNTKYGIIRNLFVFMLVLFVSNAVLSDYLNCLDLDGTELSEKEGEKESENEEGKEETERDEFLHQMFSLDLQKEFQKEALNHLENHLSDQIFEILTPPPELA